MWEIRGGTYTGGATTPEKCASDEQTRGQLWELCENCSKLIPV